LFAFYVFTVRAAATAFAIGADMPTVTTLFGVAAVDDAAALFVKAMVKVDFVVVGTSGITAAKADNSIERIV
jgi:hypothetical protein